MQTFPCSEPDVNPGWELVLRSGLVPGLGMCALSSWCLAAPAAPQPTSADQLTPCEGMGCTASLQTVLYIITSVSMHRFWAATEMLWASPAVCRPVGRHHLHIYMCVG